MYRNENRLTNYTKQCDKPPLMPVMPNTIKYNKMFLQ